MDDFSARFGGIRRLYGDEPTERLRQAHVCVVGLGGVGCWAVEALARSGIGELTLVDFDEVCKSNTNRQLHALDGSYHQSKALLLEARVRAINPHCKIHALQVFFLGTNAEEILATPFSYVLDAIDSPSKKALLIARCRAKGIPVISSGGAAGRRDPTQICIEDMADASHDRLLAQVRRELRTEHNFPRGKKKFQVETVISREPVVYPAKDGTVCEQKEPDADVRPDCASGMGSATFITGTFGFVAAARIITRIAEGRTSSTEATAALPAPAMPLHPQA